MATTVHGSPGPAPAQYSAHSRCRTTSHVVFISIKAGDPPPHGHQGHAHTTATQNFLQENGHTEKLAPFSREEPFLPSKSHI